MAMNFQLRIEQTQKVVMTLELQQAIKLLQLSTLELNDYLEKELSENPVLEIQDKEGHADDDFEGDKDNLENDLNKDEAFDWEEYINYYEPNSRSGSFEAAQNDNEQLYTYEYVDSNNYNLEEYLIFQLRMSSVDKNDFSIGEYLIGNLDACGYLQGEVAEHAGYLGIKEEKVIQILALIQTFDPPGIGARNLEECLLIQLRMCEDVPLYAETVIRRYLPELGRAKYREIACKLGICTKDLQKTIDFIRTLNPKPGACFSRADDTSYIVPDIVVEKVEGEYVFIINDNIPSLTISPFYKNLLSQGCGEQVNNFIKKRLESAMWLIKSIEQRRLTLHKVTEQIIKIQHGFLEKGIRYIKPLTLKEVADRVGIHESTVSRAAANKYIQTPRGLFPLKFFFSGGIEDSSGEERSVLCIKSYLKELLENESPLTPYSDQQLADLMLKKGFKLSRRTITKYRREMDIPSSFKRRRLE
jgi:RNA polymerase sigma-54 factor